MSNLSNMSLLWKKLDEGKVLKDRIKPMFAVCNMTCTEFTNANIKEQYLSIHYHLFLSLVWDWFCLKHIISGCERYSTDGPHFPSSIFQTNWTNSFLWEKKTDLSLNAERLCVSALLNVLTNTRTETLRDCPTWRCFHSIIDIVWAPAYTTSEDLKNATITNQHEAIVFKKLP